jgi:23S rRNA-/tRNA-specific pseudouridylate synthase
MRLGRLLRDVSAKKGDRLMTATYPMPALPPIIHQDRDCIVFDKPGGLLCHPVGAIFAWGLINIAREAFPGEDLRLVLLY